MLKINKKVFKWLLVALIMAIIFAFSAQTREESAGTSGEIVEMICRVIGECYEDIVTFAVRKLAHFLNFLALGLSVFFAFGEHTTKIKSRACYSILFCLAYAMSDEFHQLFVPGRGAMVIDVIIDFFGSAVGIVSCFLILKFKKR